MTQLGVDQPAPIRPGEELDVDKLQSFLRKELKQSSSRLVIEQFPSGFSNRTYCLTFGSQELVLRRPPFGNKVKSAHDMQREYQVLSQLADVYQPAPRPKAYSDDLDILGAEFYLMERRHGIILRGPQAPASLASDPALTRQLCQSFIDNLADLHLLDYQAAGLGELGRPEGYIGRQVEGWSGRYQAASSDDWPQMDELSAWLQLNQPTDGPAGLIHNDYKYDNLMLAADDLTRIVALLDWEMATLGDPLMDLGTTLAYWVQPHDPVDQLKRAFGPTMVEGSLTRRELIDRYADRTQRQLPDMTFYFAYGLFKLAVIIQQIYIRYLRGNTQDPRFAELGTTVESLAWRGCDVIENGVG